MKTVVLPKGWFVRDVLKAAARVKRWDAPPRRALTARNKRLQKAEVAPK